MRITDITTYNLYFDYPGRKGFRYAGGQVTSRVTSIIRVDTDSEHVGWGASYAYPDVVKFIIDKNLKAHLIGEDPCDVERLWTKLYGITRWYGRKGVAMAALSGLDIAFWDLRGKQLGQPLYKLFGGTKNYVQAYASALFWQDDVKVLEQEAARHVAKGFHHVKTRLGRNPDYDVEALAAIHRGVGKNGRVLVDGSHRYNLDTALAMAKQLEERNVYWFEEPFPPEELDLYCELCPQIKVPLAMGENEFGVQGFREVIHNQAVRIAQPDACRTGGLSECLKIAAMAAEKNIKIATHTWSDAVAVMANAHFVAAIPNGLIVEIDQTGNPFIEELLVEPLRVKDGQLLLSDRPGLGIEVNQKTLDRLSLPEGQTIPDGNYSDLIFGKEYYETPPPYLAA